VTAAKRRNWPPRFAVRATEWIALALAGRRWFPVWAIVHHRGRKSGTGYATPIAIIPTIDKNVILIGLPWGAKTNWARNVVAAGEAGLTWKGREHRAVAPRIITRADAVALARSPFQLIVRGMPAAIALTPASGDPAGGA